MCEVKLDRDFFVSILLPELRNLSSKLGWNGGLFNVQDNCQKVRLDIVEADVIAPAK